MMGDIMEVPFVNPVGFSSDNKPSAVLPDSGSAIFQNILQSKLTDTVVSDDVRTSEPAKEVQPFRIGSKQSLSYRERMILAAKGQEAIKWLAKRFGMPESFMNLILQQLGFDAVDLANPETREIVLKAIMEFFNLSEDEQESLKEDFNSFMEGLDF